ncbi:MAG: M3 family metallopeptidase, partial [Parvularculaceae bacterium]|nr:M3 family metallopeptidase [Parvularculaceae bacterium]
KKLAVSTIAVITALSGAPAIADDAKQDTAMQEATDAAATFDPANPIIAPWTGPYDGVPPWESIKVDDFIPAFDKAIEDARAEIDAITDNEDDATFENTIIALEESGDELTRLQNLFGVYSSNLNTGAVPEIEMVVYPKLAAFGDEYNQNEALFARVAAVYNDEKAMKKLKPEERRLVEDYYKGFERNGSNLDDAAKARVAEINQRLATLGTRFTQNLLADEDTVIWIEDEAELAGLPQSTIAAMASTAEEKGQPDKWAVLNTRSAADPLLTYADSRALREKVWRAFVNRGDNGDEHDNNAIIAETLKLRAERSKLLGYETYAHWAIERQMAKTPDAAMELMMTVWPKAVERVEEEVADMQAVADAEGANITIEPWDYRYYMEKVRKDKYDLDFNEVKPYLQLEKLREAMMWAAGELYGLQFEEIDDVPVFNADVRAWKVLGRDGELQGLWYFDPYARAGKSSGAWMTEYRTQQKLEGDIHPIVSNNSNFLKGAPGEPVLISWDDAETMFHEFGHALHGLNSDVKYPSQSGTNVPRDYVEFPSQLNEHWLMTPEVMNRFLVHYESNEPIPQELVNKIKDAKTFNQGFATVEYLSAAIVDMKLHLAGDADIDPDAFEKETLAEIGMPKEIVMRHRTPQFAHIFAGEGYAAGYYSYLWADAITADAAEAFIDAGSFYDKKTAKKLYDDVMSVGDSIDPADGFRKFRGRDVDTTALLRDRGFPVD